MLGFARRPVIHQLSADMFFSQENLILDSHRTNVKGRIVPNLSKYLGYLGSETAFFTGPHRETVRYDWARTLRLRIFALACYDSDMCASLGSLPLVASRGLNK